MDDDFNTAEAVGVLFELAGAINRTKSAELARQLRGLGGVLGLLQREPLEFLQGGVNVPLAGLEARGSVGQLDVAAAPSRERIDELIAQRVAAKKAMNYAEADRIRAEIDKLGAVPEDRPDGTSTWRWK